jgi:hypothetical protein
MIERSVFLHEEHDMLDILDCARRTFGGNGKSLADVCGQERHASGSGSGFHEKPSARIKLRHV